MKINDVAKYAGVSVATVSRVINNSANVSPLTRLKVEKAIKELEYIPNDVARSLVTNRTNTVGIMVANIKNYFDYQSAYSLERNLKENGIVSILCNASDNLDSKLDYLKTLREKQVDAIIAVGSAFAENDFFRSIIRTSKDIPIIMINVYSDVRDKNIIYIYCDEIDAMNQSVCRFKEKGYLNPIFISRDLSKPTRAYKKKKKGFIEALAKYYPNNEFTELIVGNVIEDFEYTYSIIKEKKIDSIQFEVDKLAVDFYRCFCDNNVEIPADLAIVGFDNSDITNYTNKKISSIDQRIDEQAKIAVTNILNILNNKEVTNINLIKAKLVNKETS